MQLMFSFKRQRFSTSGFLVGLGRRWICSQRGRTVMSFGDGSHGALGLPGPIMGVGSDVYEPTPISSLPCDVTSIASGHFHSLAVTREGHVYSWGRNTEAQLGRHPISPREKWNEPKRVEGLDKVRVRSAFASGVVSAALAEDGSLWVWGSSKNGQLGLGEGLTRAVVPSRVETLAGEHIVKASFGWGHALAMSASGKLFGWGYYADGRIGRIGGKELEISPLEEYKSPQFQSPEKASISAEEAAEVSVFEAMEKEKDMPVIWRPGLVEELLGATVEDVACGLDHSLVVCGDGTLLSGGSNAYGQLGRTGQDLGLHPVDLRGFRALCVASGVGHSLAVCEDPSSGPKVFSWGWNQSCQLGRQCPSALGHIALRVEGLDGETPKSVSAGRAHSLVVTTKNEVWAWGCGKNGRLGLCGSADEAEPMLVDFCQDFEALEAVAGLDHTLVLGEIVC